MSSPSLPWEVIERVIGHSAAGHPETVRGFSLTCRNLRPRSLCFMVDDADLQTRTQIFDFCDFLRAKPHLKPLVRSITLRLDDFAPSPLLRILPSLRRVVFDSGTRYTPLPSGAFNRPTLTCCEQFGVHVRTLYLSGFSFPTYLDFARVLLAFRNITHLICVDVIIEAEGDRAHLGPMKRRLSKRLGVSLKELDVSSSLLSMRLPLLNCGYPACRSRSLLRMPWATGISTQARTWVRCSWTPTAWNYLPSRASKFKVGYLHLRDCKLVLSLCLIALTPRLETYYSFRTVIATTRIVEAAVPSAED